MEKRYEIGGKAYVMKPLVLGQWVQLLELLKDVRLWNGMTSGDLVSAFGSRLPKALAIALRDETPLKDKNLEEWAATIAFETSPEQGLEVIGDFFDLNPISSLLEKIGKMTDRISEKANPAGSMKSASSFPEGTLPSGTGLSGT